MKREDLVNVARAFEKVRGILEKGINTLAEVKQFAKEMQLASALAHDVGLVTFDEHVTLVEACVEMESWNVLPDDSTLLFETIAVM